MENGKRHYFAYGSNMSPLRLRKRVPSAEVIGVYTLPEHCLKFHKFGRDGSAKCDAYYTGNIADTVLGVLYSFADAEKVLLDAAEGLGNGYDEKDVVLTDSNGEEKRGYLYYATSINSALSPFSWYVNHVIQGAKKFHFPASYIRLIEVINTVEDQDVKRDKLERSIY